MAKTRYGFLIDLRRCIGCRTCQVACKAENDVPLGVYRTWVKEVEKGVYPKVRRHFVPILCNQCEKPACTRVCPVRATYSLPNGIVYIDPHRCIGCRYCMAACPYSVRFIHPERKVAQKCDWCWPRVRDGFGPPACVASCPTRAMVFGDLTDPESEISRILARVPTAVLKPETGNGPMVFYIGLDDEAARLVEAGGEE
ncbi:4Fe-4S dicluster domain-containing protein [Deferrisoma camini]|uniref:4Fe-4S dicluster domain-containing protein n=1 Tax=Deferrisoma camini TaxID=1035120 RepID=UPI00046D5F28|nr:4Fe-4S dicluster domain-containing protein [Deferrisoma camini]NOY44833.1 4Fe-4S dicluster domain-containing protein [Deltaproteobacteria bacterium]